MANRDRAKHSKSFTHYQTYSEGRVWLVMHYFMHFCFFNARENIYIEQRLLLAKHYAGEILTVAKDMIMYIITKLKTHTSIHLYRPPALVPDFNILPISA